jgi:hypothetical protein
MGQDGLVAVVVDAGKVSRDLARLAIGGGLLAKVRRDSIQNATSTPARVAA